MVRNEVIELARGWVGHDEGKPLEDFREGVVHRDHRETRGTRKCDRRPLQYYRRAQTVTRGVEAEA